MDTIRFTRTQDYELVRSIITDPSQWPHVSDDFSGPRERFRVLEDDRVWYVLAWDSNELQGMFMFVPSNAICWEIHVCLLPHAWGKTARRIGARIWGWMWANTPCRRIVASVPAYNRLAIRYAIASGMQGFGSNARSFLKGGRLHDQVLLGISPEGRNVNA